MLYETEYKITGWIFVVITFKKYISSLNCASPDENAATSQLFGVVFHNGINREGTPINPSKVILARVVLLTKPSLVGLLRTTILNRVKCE